MRSTFIITLLTVVLIGPNTYASSKSRIAIKALEAASLEAKVPFRLLAAICSVESSLNPYQKPHDDNGSLSYGMCQIKEGTARLLGFNSKANILSNVGVNTYYAAKYLKKQLERYNGDWIVALAAYNAGSAHWHIRNQDYVTKVLARAVTF